MTFVGNLTKQEIRKIIKQPKANKRKFKDRKVGKMLNETREILNDFYRPFNEEIAQILNDDQFLWGEDDDDDYYVYDDEK